MNILITGIHGFVGSNLTNALKGSHTIYGLDIISPVKDGVEKTYAWEDFDSIPPVDVIIHLAGKAHDTRNQSKSQTYFDINLGLTSMIYDYFLKSSATKFVFFSSVKAAADMVIGDILTEDVIPTPKGPYGESKHAAEKYIQARMPLKDKSVYILRPCMIHGPGNKGNLNLLYNVVKMGLPWPLGAFDNKRTYTSINNLCYLIQGFVSQDIASGVYNIADDEALSTNELIRSICEVTNRPFRILKFNRGFMEKCATIGSVLHLPYNTDRLMKLTENYVVSNAKIKKALGIESMPVSARDGLNITLRSFDTNSR